MKKEKNSKKWLFISLGLFITFIVSMISVAFIWFSFPVAINMGNSAYNNDLTSVTLSESAELTDIESISISSDIADLYIEPYSGTTASIEYQANNNAKLNVNSSNGRLTVDATYKKGTALDFDFLSKNNIKLIVKLPESYNKEISVHNNLGNIDLKGSFSNTKLFSELGDVIAETDTEYLEANCSMGNAKITGNISSSKLTSNLGNIDYKPTLSEKGEHTLESNVGNIHLDLDEESDVTVSAKTSIGEINNKLSFTNIIEDDKSISCSFLATNKGGTSTIDMECDSGEITID